MKTVKENEREAEETAFVSQDNLWLDQVRLENLWLRQRMQALSRREQEKPKVDQRRLAA